MLYLTLLIGYSLAQMALGLWIGRRVRSSSDFYVAGRALGPGLIFFTMLAANIGAGSTVGAAGLGYQDGLAAVWWVGSAALGSFVLAFCIGPAIRRVSAANDLRTVGDFLEFRYGRSVRTLIAALLWIAALFLLAGQLIGIAWILNVVIGLSKPVGCALGALVITVYFSAGGLLTSAWVNVVQLIVKLAGFALALPLALSASGGWGEVRMLQPTADYWNPWSSGSSGIAYLAMLGPAFVVSPGLLQKIYGARDDRAVRLGVGMNALGLLLYALIPVVLGMVARLRFGYLPHRDLALPTVFMYGVPPAVGALGVAAVFSAEISAADATLFMLTTSVSQDFYRRFLRPGATDADLLLMTRLTAIAAGLLAAVIGLLAESVIDALRIFYTVLAVSLFVPVIAGLYSSRAGTREALAAIVAGIAVVAAVQISYGAQGVFGLTPAMAGLIISVTAFGITLAGNTKPKVEPVRLS
jgi:SSS family solute:Na+ symporter